MTDVRIRPADGVAASAVKQVRLSTAVWALGLTSLFMDISSEMIHSLLPVFVVVSSFLVSTPNSSFVPQTKAAGPRKRRVAAAL